MILNQVVPAAGFHIFPPNKSKCYSNFTNLELLPVLLLVPNATPKTLRNARSHAVQEPCKQLAFFDEEYTGVCVHRLGERTTWGGDKLQDSALTSP